MGEVQERLTSVATTYGRTSFDEMGVRFTGRHRGVSYNRNKPEPFSFCFYAEVASDSLYVQQLQVNNRGTIQKNMSRRYVEQYPRLNLPLSKTVKWMQDHLSAIKMSDETALWMAMITQPYVRA